MINLIKSTFYKEQQTKKEICDFITKSSILSMSLECKKFENNFSKKQNRRFGTMVNSGSSANLLLIQSLLNLGRINRGDMIAVSALTWPTNVMPLIQLGLKPILVDCEIETLNVSLNNFKKTFQKHSKLVAFLITNALGHCDNIKEISDYCKDNNIILLEDNCESLGSKTNSKLLGNFGLASTFSFFVGHHLSTIEGGMICTDDEDLKNSLVMSRAHGWDRHLNKKAQKDLRTLHDVNDFYSKYTFYDLSYNIRPNEINGFLGNLQLKYLDEIVDKRFNNFLEIHRSIDRNDDLIKLNFEHMDIVSSFAIPIIAKSKHLQNMYINKFVDSNVEVRPMIAGNMSLQPFFKKYVSLDFKLENTNFLHENSFYIGNNPELTECDLKVIKSVIDK